MRASNYVKFFNDTRTDTYICKDLEHIKDCIQQGCTNSSSLHVQQNSVTEIHFLSLNPNSPTPPSPLLYVFEKDERAKKLMCCFCVKCRPMNGEFLNGFNKKCKILTSFFSR